MGLARAPCCGSWRAWTANSTAKLTRFKHPALLGHEKQLRKCLQNPECVRESAKDSDVHLFYTESEGVFLCVVTAPAHDEGRFVVTAYFTTNIKEGTKLWKK